ncbi:DUF2164 family protein [Oceanobacillus sp. 143]|jgi:uncharacterized protein (DUF2164 family)|uniref:DUF2164 domain-containing protein n=1 Tax=Oceanobacillus zhaokaii TaxID=2052660 RepID=A0A345PJD9_9BACI|nr:DUF2164 domain-containing protein [Oceanobacillus zhaokaii]AXI10119.1 DUF2164 domain-containing protein [Oceanobacillus zhaokaii]QGS69247.1 DUF2164 family protein [Oceanobacillus sp. 143]
MSEKIVLSKEQRDEMIALIRNYFEKNMDEPIGELKAMMLLDFITTELAPKFYNLGVEESHIYLAAKLDDLFEIQK